MKTIKVEIIGTSPLLMNSPKAMLEPQEAGITNKKKKYVPKIEAEKVCYRTKNGKLFVPAEAIKGTMINAATGQKDTVKKMAVRPLVAAGVRISPKEIILNKQEYEIDQRTVVIQRNRVVKWRPLIKDWKLSFDINYNDEAIDSPVLHKLLEQAGKWVGILDFRPQKLGEFGMFEISKWEEK